MPQDAHFVAGYNRRSAAEEHQNKSAHKFREIFLHSPSCFSLRFRARKNPIHARRLFQSQRILSRSESENVTRPEQLEEDCLLWRVRAGSVADAAFLSQEKFAPCPLRSLQMISRILLSSNYFALPPPC